MSGAEQSTIDALWDFNEPAASEDRFRAAAESANGAQLGEIQTQIARAMGLQGRFDDGHAALDAVAETGSSRVQVLIALERGRLFNSAGDRAVATGHFQAAVDLARHAGEAALEIDALHMLANADVEHASRWNNLALERARASDLPAVRRWLGSLLNNQGWTRFDRGDFHAALVLFEEALAHFVERGDPEPIRIARWTVARCLRALGEHEAAMVILRDLESNHSRCGWLCRRGAGRKPAGNRSGRRVAHMVLAGVRGT